MPLGPEDIYLYARHAGFSPDQAVTMTAIAMAESGGVLTAHNPNGEDSKGLWQINHEAHPKFHGLDASDPLTNARMAFEVSGGGSNIRPWTVTHSDKGAPYQKFLDDAEAASRAYGENGIGQHNPPANYKSASVPAGQPADIPPPAPLPDAVPDDSDAAFTPAFGGQGSNLAQQSGGAPPGQAPAPAPTQPTGPADGVDSDADGLLDSYESAVGLDANSVDSDGDGFTDVQEILEFKTDATDFASNPLGATGGEALAGGGPAAPPPTPIPYPNESGPSGEDFSDVGVAPGAAPAPQDFSDVGVAPGAAPPPQDFSDVGVAPGPGAAPQAPLLQTVVQGPPLMATAQNTSVAAPGGGNKLDQFLDAALAQDGKPYVFGTEVSGDTLDPDALDCSELVEWAGHQAGVTIPDGSFNQYLHTKQLGGELTVEEALQTPGALLFKFSSTPTPGGGRPSVAHVAISLGDGRTIEARNTRVGTGIMDAGDMEWTHAGVVPEMGTELSGDFGPGIVTEAPQPIQPVQMGADSDEDGLLDAYERMIGSDPFNADTDQDGFIDSVETHEHNTDPLDFTDNALTSASPDGYRPPLTTESAPTFGQMGGAGQGAPQGNIFDDVGVAPGSGGGSGGGFGGGGSGGGSGQGSGGGQGADQDQGNDNGQGQGEGQAQGTSPEPEPTPPPAEDPPAEDAPAEDPPAEDAVPPEEPSPAPEPEPEPLTLHPTVEDHPEFLEAIEAQDLDFDTDGDGVVGLDDFDDWHDAGGT